MDTKHELLILVTIAKLDAALDANRRELATLPDKIQKIDKRLAAIEASETEAREHAASMASERRSLEQSLEDRQVKIKRLRIQLMEVKTNKEYTAMQHEIQHLEREIDASEERLLILMDELDQQNEQNKVFLANTADEKKALKSEKSAHENRTKQLQAEMQKLEAQKPGFLAELEPQIRKRYDRVLAKLHDYAVTNVVDGVCQGCFTRIPPQTGVEVRQNDRIISCEACGRILVHYEA